VSKSFLRDLRIEQVSLGKWASIRPTALASPLERRAPYLSNRSPVASLSRSTIEKHSLPRIVVSDDGPKILVGQLR
jgi:hypothetical protein